MNHHFFDGVLWWLSYGNNVSVFRNNVDIQNTQGHMRSSGRKSQEPLVGNCLLKLTDEKKVKWGHSLPFYLLLSKGKLDFTGVIVSYLNCPGS